MTLEILGLTLELPSRISQGWVAFISLGLSIIIVVLGSEICGDYSQKGKWRKILGRIFIYPGILLIIYPGILLIILTALWWLSVIRPVVQETLSTPPKTTKIDTVYIRNTEKITKNSSSIIESLSTRINILKSNSESTQEVDTVFIKTPDGTLWTVDLTESKKNDTVEFYWNEIYHSTRGRVNNYLEGWE